MLFTEIVTITKAFLSFCNNITYAILWAGDSVVEFGAEFVEGEEGNIIYEMARPHDLLIPYSRFIQNTVFVNNSGKYEKSKYVLQLIEKANNILYTISTATDGSLKDYFVPRYEKNILWFDFYVTV